MLDRVARAQSRTGPATEPDPATSRAPYRLYNIGNNSPVELMHYISLLEECLGKKAEKNLLPLQPGDVPDTYADVDDLARDRLSPGHSSVGGGCPVRRLVSGVLSGLMDPEIDFRSRSLSDARAPGHLAAVSLSSHHFHASRGMVTRSISFIPQCRF